MDCLVHPQHPFWTGAVTHGLPNYHQRNYLSNFYFPRKGTYGSSYYPGTSLFFPHDDDVDYPTDMKGELTSSTMPYPGMADDNGEVKLCVVCGERASGFYFGALVCLPCKSFYIRCTKDGEPAFTCQCSGNCDIVKQGRIRCQYCRYQRCLMAGMCRKEKPETVQPAEGQVLCKVCGDIANGIHFGVNTCEGCKKFFRRGLVENSSYICKGEKDCGINPRNRNNCRYCRYQKCLSVGMSREAIKMGRPKKADGSDAVSPPTSASPTATRGPFVDLDSCNQHTDNPHSGNNNNNNNNINNNALKTSSVSEKIKEEDRPSCEYVKKNGESWTQGQEQRQGLSSWQPCSQSKMVANGSSSQAPGQGSTSRNGNVASSEFIEEEMDEILMLLQNDNNNNNNQQGGDSSWRSGNKKLRACNYSMMAAAAQKECKTEYCEGQQQQQQGGSSWHVTELTSPQHNSNMSPMNMSMNNEPMNMSTSHMSQLAARPPPPQYPGFGADFQQEQMPVHSAMSSSSPCNSPHRQMPSPGGYMSDASAHSPGYVHHTSPAHSPCQYTPEHSPMHQNPSSPQQSGYQSDSSQPGSAYNEPLYHPSSFRQPPNYTMTDLSVNVNCPQPGLAPRSPPQGSPSYTSPMNLQSSSSLPMTIPPQEGGASSHDGWNMTGSPSSHYCLGSSPCGSQTHPHQDRSCRRHSTWYENLQRINQFFSQPPAPCVAAPPSDLTLLPDEEMEGTVTRNDIEREVVYKTLSSLSPAESYYYVMADSHACSSDSNCSPSYEEFTSCRRINKRKSFDHSDNCDSSSAAQGFQFGRYKRQATEKYWQHSVATETAPRPMTVEKQALLEHLNKLFQQMSERCSESSKPVTPQDGRNWQQIQLRIVRNTTAGVKFASQIPGFNVLHPEDKTYLCKTVTFMTSLLMAGHQQFSPAERNFQDFWSWNIQPHNPFYPFKQHLVHIGETIHNMKLDQYEVSSLAALMYLAADFMDLVYPEAVEEARKKIIDSLQSYILSKGGDAKSRLSEMFGVVPEIRHAGMWQQELMKQMKVNIQLQEVHQILDHVQYRES